MRVRAAAAAAGVAVVAVLAAAPPASAEPAVDVGGTPVTGGTRASDPTPLEAGLWSDTLGPADSEGDVLHYSYARTMADSTVRVGVVASSASGASDGVELEVTAPGDDFPCASESASSVTPTEFATFGASAVVGPSEPGARDETCLTADTLRISVARDSFTDGEGDLPVAIKVVEEAPVGGDGVDDLPVPEESPSFLPPADGAASEVAEGSTSLDDAPVVGPGSTWSTEIAPGEQRLWRVRLGWGQGLSVRADVAAQDAEAERILQYDTPAVELAVVTPMRGVEDSLVEGAEPTGYYDGDEPSRLTTGVAPVAYLGRFGATAPSVPGDYWIGLAGGVSDEPDAPAAPVELTVDVTGDPPGEPPYVEAVTAPGGGEGPEGYDPATPFLVAAGTFAPDPSGNPVVPGDDAAGPDARRWWGAGLGVLSVLCCAAGAWRLRAGLRVG